MIKAKESLKGSFDDLEHLQLVANRIAESNVDITSDYQDWVRMTLACAALGEEARESYHKICSQYPRYQRAECDAKFDNCLRTGRGDISLGTLMKLAQDHGIDTSLPRGRRPMSKAQKKAEEANRIHQMRELLEQWAEWRFNVWRQRPEFRESVGKWRPVQDRDLDTFYCRLRENGINVKLQDLKSLIFSRDFSKDFDAVKSWFLGLKPWNPDKDPDYLHEFYIKHLEFSDPENTDFYESMFDKFHAGMVALMKGDIDDNPLMLIFKGRQHIGKSIFSRYILPPELREYLLEVGPSERIDKDFIISLSETPLILFDEISFGSYQKNEAFKYIVTSTRSNVRDAYAHFRESRERRASLVATTNEETFIRESEGSRRYLVVDLKGTVNLYEHPLPYEGAYAQALWLLENGFDPKPTREESEEITKHNQRFLESNDAEEAINTFLRHPDGIETERMLSAGDLMQELGTRGFHGPAFNSNNIGKAMCRLGFERKKINGYYKYRVVVADYESIQKEQKIEAVRPLKADSKSGEQVLPF